MTDYLAEIYKREFDPGVYQDAGVYSCAKNKEAIFTTFYERVAFSQLDVDASVVKFRVRNRTYEYFDPLKDRITTSKIHIEATYVDRSRAWIYVTPYRLMSEDAIVAQIEGAEMAATGLGHKFEVWNELKLFGRNPDYMFALRNYFRQVDSQASSHLIPNGSRNESPCTAT